MIKIFVQSGAVLNLYPEGLDPEDFEQQMNRIEQTGQGVTQILNDQGVEMGAAFDRIKKEVEETRAGQASLITAFAKIAQEIRDNAGNEAALNELADSLDQGQTEMAQAVANDGTNSGGGTGNGDTGTGNGDTGTGDTGSGDTPDPNATLRRR